MITVSYDLNPPPETVTDNLQPSKTHQFEVKASQSEGIQSFYEAVVLAVGEAKNTLGKELTDWKDAVGNGENFKETKKVKDDEESDESDEEVTV
jgi:hypothetical protein